MLRISTGTTGNAMARSCSSESYQEGKEISSKFVLIKIIKGDGMHPYIFTMQKSP